MTGPVPTKVGDVLILHATKAGTPNAVGPVLRDGQQDLDQAQVEYFAGRFAADLKARGLVGATGRIFVVNAENGHWTEVSP